MTQLDFAVSRTDLLLLPPLDSTVKCTFQNSAVRAAWLPAGAHVYRYGASVPQVAATKGSWLNVTEDRFDVAEDALQSCSLLDVTLRDMGERYVMSGERRDTDSARESWNTAALRGELVAKERLLVWTGRVAPLAFDRRQGIALTGSHKGDVHLLTRGGASQILVPAAHQDVLQTVGKHTILPRVRIWQ